MIRIQGKVNYFNLETGFWGIEATNGQKYLPINMPEQLKSRGKSIQCTVVKVPGDSFFQWGEMVRIVSFETTFP